MTIGTIKVSAITWRRRGTWSMTLLVLAVTSRGYAAESGQAPDTKSSNSEYADFYTGQSGTANKGIDWVQAIAVSSPAYCSDIKDDVTVNFAAPGMTKAEALCWQQPTRDNPSVWGHDVIVANIAIDASGNGSFVFHADQFPNGPITLRIHARDEGKKQDLCQLQLFNRSGVAWNQGIPKSDPPAAAGLKLAFGDDFNGPLSISGDGKGATYESHKTGGGDFSGWPFTNASGPLNPFSQVGTWMRIHASKPAGTKGSTGIISSARQDGTGTFAIAPCYFECRFLAQSAPGTWPAFWTSAKKPEDRTKNSGPCDELDIIEAYGGMGPKNPNFIGYASTSHFWGQPKPAWSMEKRPDGKPLHPGHADIPMMDLGGKSTWSTTFHTYGVLVTLTDTVYYFDDIEVLRHPSGEISASQPFWFMINYAIGGISGWHVDLARYGNQSDMWVDYVRVYQGEHAPATQPSAGIPSTNPTTVTTAAPTAPDMTQAPLVEEIKKLGGKVKTEGDVPDGPIVDVTFTYTHTKSKSPGGTTVPDYDVTDDLVGQIAKLPKLTHLELNMCPKVTDAGVHHLKAMTQLQALALSDTQVSDVGMADLAGLTNLQYLRFSVCTRVTDKGWAYLEGMIAETRMNDTGMVHLKGLTELKEITLYGTPVTDAGVEELKGLSKLESLRVSPKVTNQEINKLKEEHPNCRVYR